MTYVKIPVPRLDAGLLSNLLGVIGLLMLVITPGGVTHNWWWSVLAGGVAAVAVSYLLALQTRPADEENVVTLKTQLREAK